MTVRVRVGEGWAYEELHTESFVFPDGQPHVTTEIRHIGKPTQVVARIRDGQDLLEVLLAVDALRGADVDQVNLFITYLLGARMDRRIPRETEPDGAWQYHPFTLKVVADVLRTGHFSRISVLDPHSDVACALLNATAVSPERYVNQALFDLGANSDIVLIAPDAGASKQVTQVAVGNGLPVVQCFKHRDVHTGKLSGFGVENTGKLVGARTLIIDDICDGGGTFVGLAKELRAVGAEEVHLYVTHGIFSNGTKLEGIDRIFMTDSYQDFSSTQDLTVYPVKC